MENKINWVKRHPTFVRKKVLLPTISRIYREINDVKTSKTREEIVIKQKCTDEKWTWKQLPCLAINETKKAYQSMEWNYWTDWH